MTPEKIESGNRRRGAFAQDVGLAQPRVANGGRESGQDGGHTRGHECECEDRSIDRDLVEPRNRHAERQILPRQTRGEDSQRVNAAPRERDAGNRAGHGDERALGQELTRETRASRAECDANGDLPLA